MLYRHSLVVALTSTIIVGGNWFGCAVRPNTIPGPRATEYPEIVLLKTPSPAEFARFSGDGTRLVVAAQTRGPETTFQVWDTRSGEPIGPKIHHGKWFSDASLNASGTILFTECTPISEGDDSIQRDVRCWNTQTGNMLRSPIGNRIILDAALSPDGRRVATCSVADQGVQYWDTDTGDLLATFDPGRDVDFLQFDRAGEQLFSTADSVHVWNVRTAKLVHEFPKGYPKSIRSVRPALSENGRIAVATWSGVDVYNIGTGQLIARAEAVGAYLKGGAEEVQCDSKMTCVTVVIAGKAFGFDIDRNQPLIMPELGAGEFTLSPCGQTIAMHSENRSGLWDPRAGHHVNRSYSDEGLETRWLHAAFNATGDRLAIISTNGIAIVKRVGAR